MLSYWDPFVEMNRLQDQLRGRRGEAAAAAPAFRPAVDIREEEKSFVVYAELPGVKAGDVHVDVEKNVLTIKGERSRMVEGEEAGWKRVERAYGAFSRTFTLPETVDPDAIEARLEDGVLAVRIPKREAPAAKRIEIKAA